MIKLPTVKCLKIFLDENMRGSIEHNIALMIRKKRQN